MADRKLKRYIAQANKAYRKNNRKKGAQLVDKILQIDFNHRGAWELLYRVYGNEQGMESFRVTFAQRHYPEYIHLLQKFQELPEISEIPEKKPSIFARLFKRKQKPSQAQKTEQTPPTAQERVLTNDYLTPAPFSTASEKPSPPAITSARAGLLRETQTLEPQNKSQFGSSQTTSTTGPQSTQTSAGGKYRVLVVDDIPETRENIIRSLMFNDSIEVVGTASNGYQAIEMARKLKPEVVLMDVNMPDMDGIHATAAIRREVPTSQVIILTVQDDLDYMRNAMLAGARDFLTKPPMIDELSSAVQRAAIFARQEIEKVEQVDSGEKSGGLQINKGKGKVISVYSPRGGAGCTTIAANLAAVLHKEDTPVVIIDGNLQYGDIPVIFNAQGNHSLADLIPRLDEMDADLVNEVLIHHSSGIDILAPTKPEEASLVSGEQFQRVIDFFAKLYSYVLVDCPTQLSDTTLAALESSDLSILLITQDIPSIARAKKFLDLAPLIHLEPKRMLVAINQYDKRVGITPEKLGETLKKEITAVIPLSAEIAIAAINRGIPFMLQKQTFAQPLGRAVLELVEAVRQQVSSFDQDT